MRLVSAALVCGAFFLAACDTKPISALTYAERVELEAKFKATCAANGAPEGNSKHATCMQAEMEAEDARRAGNVELAGAFEQAGKNFESSYNAGRGTRLQCQTTAYTPYTSTTNCY